MVRNTKKIRGMLSLKGTEVYASKTCKIHIPKYFMDKKLLLIASNTLTMIGLFNIIIDGEYLTIRSPLMYICNYDNLSDIVIGEEDYYEVTINKGNALFDTNVNLNAFMSVEMIELAGLRGKMPYYCTERTNLRLHSNMGRLGGFNLDSDPTILEMVFSRGQRTVEDNSVLFRHDPKGTYVQKSLMDITYGTSSNFGRLLGNYQADGEMESLSLPDSKLKPTKVETILRS